MTDYESRTIVAATLVSPNTNGDGIIVRPAVFQFEERGGFDVEQLNVAISRLKKGGHLPEDLILAGWNAITEDVEVYHGDEIGPMDFRFESEAAYVLEGVTVSGEMKFYQEGFAP